MLGASGGTFSEGASLLEGHLMHGLCVLRSAMVGAGPTRETPLIEPSATGAHAEGDLFLFWRVHLGDSAFPFGPQG